METMRERVEKLEKLAAEAVEMNWDGFLISAHELSGNTPEWPGADDLPNAREAIDAAKIDENHRLKLEEYANGKWHIRLERVYDDAGNAIGEG